MSFVVRKEYNVPKIFFIKGVFIKDCFPIDDIFEQQIIDQLRVDQPVITYVPTPSTFKGMSSWVKKTSVRCWYCDLSFDNAPVFIPRNIEYDGVAKDHRISTFGCFCSFSCAITFNNLYNQQVCTNSGVKEMLLFLYEIFHAKKINFIPQAPNKYLMVTYGGHLEPMEYRQMINNLSADLLK
jgi:hypothetical protein